MKKITLIVMSCLMAMSIQAQNLKLWYSKPAQNWTEALPIGCTAQRRNFLEWRTSQQRQPRSQSTSEGNPETHF